MTAHQDLFQQAHLAHQTAARLEKELDQAKLARQTLQDQVLQQICPFYSAQPKDRFIPLDQDRALIHTTIALHFPEDPSQPPFWVAQGQEIVFRMGGPQKTRPHDITQAQFEALPQTIQALTAADMEISSEAPIGMDKPLKLSERQMSMFMLLSRSDMTRSSPFKHCQEGQRLPHNQWDSFSATVDIWRSLVRRGVLHIVSGNAFHSWKVNPGPRFQEAIDLILTTPGFLPEGAPVRTDLMALRNATAPASTAPIPPKAPKP